MAAGVIAPAPARLVRVVIADDSAALRALLRSMLAGDGGFEVAGEAADGADAVREVVRERPDIVLLDLAMPVMDGLETIPIIARLVPETRIAVLSSFDADHSEKEALRCGAHAYLNKNATLDTVVDRLRSLCPDVANARPRSPQPARETETLLQAEDRYQTIAREVTDYGIFMLDRQGRVESWNVGAERMTGYTAGEIIGRPFSYLYPAADVLAGSPDQALAEAAASGRFESDGRAVRKDGSRFWAHLVLNVLRDHDGAVRGFASVTQDITARRESEDALRREAARLTAIIDTALNALVGVDEDGMITTWSAQAERLFGWPREEVLGQSLVATLVPAPLRDDYGAWIRAYALHPEIHSSGIVVHAVCLRRDGGEFPAELTISPPLQGERGGLEFISFVQDISDRARSKRVRAMQFEVTRILAEATSVEEVASAVLGAMAEAFQWPLAALWLPADHDGRLHQVAAWHAPDEHLDAVVAAGAGAALERGEDLAGRVWAGGGPETSVEGRTGGRCREAAAAAADLTAAAAFPVMLRGGVVGVVELRGRRPVPLDDTVTQVMEDVGHRIGQSLERMEALRDLHQKAEHLERSNAELEQFARIASHDLQEPLRTVASYVQLLKRRCGGRLGEDADEYIEFAVDGATRMQALITDLLAYSRAARAQPELASVDVAACVDTARSNLGASIADSGAEVVHGRLPTIHADARQLVQLFQNLLGNAVKFHSDAPPRIEIDARRQGGEWLFSVSDNGIGIDPGQAERVFEVFQRLHTRDEYPGTGIGLALCRKVVERLGGRIWVESERGHGSTFRFTVPDHPGGSTW